jgi:hypothetical protein
MDNVWDSLIRDLERFGAGVARLQDVAGDLQKIRDASQAGTVRVEDVETLVTQLVDRVVSLDRRLAAERRRGTTQLWMGIVWGFVVGIIGGLVLRSVFGI